MYFERYLNFMKWKSSVDAVVSKNAAKVSNGATLFPAWALAMKKSKIYEFLK